MNICQGVRSLAWISAVVLLSICATGSINSSLKAAERKSPFSVQAVIEMQEFVEPLPPSRFGTSPTFAFSPDKSRFLVITRKGDLKRNVNSYELRVHHVDRIKAYLNADGSAAPHGTVIATMETAGSRLGIEQARWKDDAIVTYLGRTGDDRSVLYEFDTRTGENRKLIDPGSTITHYEVNRNSNYVVFAVIEHEDLTERNLRGYPVGNVYFSDLTARSGKDLTVTQAYFYVFDTSTMKKHRLDIPPDVNTNQWGALPQMPLITMAPDGKSALVLAPARDVPAHWEAFQPIKDYFNTYESTFGLPVDGKEGLLRDLTDAAIRPNWLKQFYLADLGGGKAEPVLDAPSGYAGWSPQVLWSKEGRHVVFGPTFVPPETVQGSERDARLNMQSLVRMDLETRTFEVISSESYMLTGNLEEQADGSICMRLTSRTQSLAPSACYQRVSGRWITAPGMIPAKTSVPLILGIEEDMNSPPVLTALDPETQKQRDLVDLNPQLSALAVPQMEVFEWKDRLGRAYKGGLVFPPGFSKAQRYPVVLQVNGFSEGEFLLDGGNSMSAGYAARPLAAQGILVLQMTDIPYDPKPLGTTFNWEIDAENQRFMLMVEGAIDRLDEDKLIDRSKVGIIGFSRGGMNTLHAITFSEYKFAAATIAHSVQTTPWGYFALSGIAFPNGMYEFESESNIGAPLWKDGIDLWLKRSPGFHLHKIDAALRIENYTPSVPEQWEVFAQLRRHQRPVELVQINDGQHQLEPPWARHASLQGNVDWYSFWLKGEEDPNPVKANQYLRWRKLRQMRDRVVDDSRVEAPQTNEAKVTTAQ